MVSSERSRAALQSLFAGTQSRGDVPAGGGRSAYHSEIHKAVVPPKHLKRLSDLEATVAELLKEVPKKAPATQPAKAKPPRVATAEAGVQVTYELSEELREQLRDAGDLHLEDYPAPVPARPLPSMGPHLVIKDRSQQELRNQFSSTRGWNKTLHEHDHGTTTLTRQLKECRKESWQQQLRLSDLEHSVANVERSANVDEATREELRALEAEEKALLAQIFEDRVGLRKWAMEAKRRDQVVQQQERDCQDGRAMLRLFARHPAGEIAGLPFAGESDSEDDEDYRPGGRGGDVALASSGDEDSEARTLCPARPNLRHRALSLDEDESSQSDGSVGLTSPSNATAGSGLSVERPAMASGASSRPAERRRGLDTCADGSSDEEAKEPKKTAAPPEANASGGTSVPPLPEMASGAKVEGSSDEIVEEIYSDFDDDDDGGSSRSV